jgi:hypothetical protein
MALITLWMLNKKRCKLAEHSTKVIWLYSSLYSCKAGLRYHKPNVKLMLMTAFELTEMEMNDEGQSLRIDRQGLYTKTSKHNSY